MNNKNLSPLVIDFNTVVKNNKNKPDKLEEFVDSKLNLHNYFNPILILIIPNENQNFLDKLEKGYQKIKYINSNTFINSIVDYCFFDCNLEIKSINIYENLNKNYIDLILETVLTYFSTDFKIILKLGKNIDFDIVLFYFSKNFDFPEIDSEYNLILYRKNKIYEKLENKLDFLTNYLDFVLKNFEARLRDNQTFIDLQLVLESDTIKYLSKVLLSGATVNKDNSITQKEIGGRFYVKDVKLSNFIHILDFDKDSISYGDEDKVYVVEGLYNIHSHPKSAYQKYQVKYGWPSAQDYIGFLSSVFVYNTILHTVLSIEGIYFISLTKKARINIEKLVESKVFTYIMKYITKMLESVKNIKQYLLLVNNIKVEGNKVFSVVFEKWNKKNINITIPITCDTKTRDLLL